MIKYKEILTNTVNWLKANTKTLIIIALVITIIAIVGKDNKIIPLIDNNDAVLLKPIPPKVPAPVEITPEVKEEFCATPQQYVIETNQLLQTGNFIVLDLDTFENFKTKRIDNKRIGYYYRRSGSVKEYYTIFKNEPKSNGLNK